MVEVWIISWARDTHTELHDHGGSAGAMRMIHGTLTETFLIASGMHHRTLRPGRTTGFSPRYVHDVRNDVARPAMSVQAYSPPLSQMTFYAMSEGVAVPVRTEMVAETALA